MDSSVSFPRGIVNSQLQGSPIWSAVHYASSSKPATPSPWSPSRGMSPSRGRNSVASSLSSRFVNEPSGLSFVVDFTSGKIGENKVVDAHLLRLLNNRKMQWCFVNARAGAALSIQTLNAEGIIEKLIKLIPLREQLFSLSCTVVPTNLSTNRKYIASSLVLHSNFYIITYSLFQVLVAFNDGSTYVICSVFPFGRWCRSMFS